MKRIPIYCNFDRLLESIQNTQVNLIDPDRLAENKAKANYFDFLLYGADIYSNANSEKIAEIAATNPVIKYWIKQQSLNVDCALEMELTTNNKTLSLNHPMQMVQVGTMRKAMAPAWKQQTGWAFLNNDAEYPHYFSHHILNFKPDQQIDWNIVAQQIEAHHSILVVDPYIFEQNGLTGLCKLLKNIAPQKLDKTYQITLIGKSEETKKQLEKKVKNKLDEVLSASYKLELFSINKEAFHDRYLFTNNVMIFSGYGFDLTNMKDQIKKDTTWHIYQPFQRIDDNKFGYQIMQQKLSLFHKWIDYKSENRLFKIL